MSDQVAKALLDVACSVGVDIATRRNINPNIRALGQAYRVYSIVRPAFQLANAIRISAYADATTFICQEIIVQFASHQIAKKLISSEIVNYEVVSMAEELVLSVDFARDAPNSVHYLNAPYYVLETDILSRDYMEHGRGLTELVGETLFRGARAYEKAKVLVRHEEAARVRRPYNFARKEMWFDRLNHSIGSVLWQPVPEIGLGKSVVAQGLIYSGTFRRNDAEGYGCLEWKNGTRYFGQINDGRVCGYGGFYYADGGRYFGYRSKHSLNNIGAYITPNQDRVVIGIGRGNYPASYGRQIGLKNGVESVSGFWSSGQLIKPMESMEQTNQKIADSMSSSFTHELKAEYQSRAYLDRAKQGVMDAALLSHLRPFL